MSGDDLCQHIAQISLRIDAVHFASFDERGNDRPVLAAAVGTGEEMVFAPECNGADGALDHIGVDLDAAVVEESNKAAPAGGGETARARVGGLPGEGGKPGFEPETQVVDER